MDINTVNLDSLYKVIMYLFVIPGIYISILVLIFGNRRSF